MRIICKLSTQPGAAPVLRELTAQPGERLSDALMRAGIFQPRPCGGHGRCGKCRALVDGEETLACQYVVERPIIVELPMESAERSTEAVRLSQKATELPPESVERCEPTLSDAPNGAADDRELVFDLGTTTLALALVERRTRRTLRVVTAPNPQRHYGADVISRIDYAGRHGVGELARLIREALSGMIARLGVCGLRVCHVAGNTTMLHLLAGVDPSPMGFAPYTPGFLDARTLDAQALGIAGVETLRLLPSIGAFVGADLVAGAYQVGLPEAGYRVLLDLGTNAEVLLMAPDRILATAAAAGPCFEGANISCGMSATAGAVCAWDGVQVRTVDDAPPVGICATGLIDVIARLRRTGVIDETGYMEEDFVLCPGVTLTQADVRQYQLAKSAVNAALLTLLRQWNVDFSDIDALHISGGFASAINIDSAVATGLLPAALREVCVPQGNTSLSGAIRAVFDGCDLSGIAGAAQYVDLGGDGQFAELFMSGMYFEA